MKRPLCLVCVVCIIILCFYEKFGVTSIPPDDIATYDEIRVIGSIVKKEEKKEDATETTILYIKSNQYSSSNQSELFQTTQLGIICYIDNLESSLLEGQLVQLKGTYVAMTSATNPGQFDFKEYYDRLGYSGFLFDCQIEKMGTKYNILGEFLYQLKQHISNTISEIYKKQEEGIIKGILIGIKSEIDDELMDLYQRNGIIHILAISGLHISILGVGAYELLRKCKVSILYATIFSCIFMVLYGIFLGASVSLIRAIGMFLLRSLARLIGRTYDMYTALSIMGLVILVTQPQYASHSGFWLSFGSVLGIVTLLPIFKTTIKKDSCLKQGLEGFCASISITIMTLPIMLYFYYEVSVYSVLLNLLVIPCMTLIMGATVANLTLAYVIEYVHLMSVWMYQIEIKYKCYYLCYGIANVQGALLKVIEYCCLFIDQLPYNRWIVGRPSSWQMISYYLGMILILIFYYKVKWKENIRVKICMCLLVLLPLIFCVQSQKNLEIHFLNVGQGDCTIIFYEQYTFIIDAGSTTESDIGENIVIPFLKYHGRNTVHAVFITHPDADHYNGITQFMEIAEQEGMHIKQLYLPYVVEESVANNTGMTLIKETASGANVPISYVSSGSSFYIGELEFLCLHPNEKNLGTDPNQYSIVQYIRYRDFTFLTMGDAEETAEELVLQQLREMEIKDISVLKVGHHGAAQSSTEIFLEQVSPSIAVLCCGQNNRYGHPNEGVIQRIEAVGGKTYITYETGAFTIQTNGKNMWLEQFLE